VFSFILLAVFRTQVKVKSVVMRLPPDRPT
jgi:hypothetical protein